MDADIFLKELKRLSILTPKPQTFLVNCDSCEYADKSMNSKNLFNCFDTNSSIDCSDCYDSHLLVSSQDCDYAVESELCYESVDIFKAYNCAFLDNCAHIRDSYYSYNCINSNNLFGCCNLRNKQYCIFNRQFTPEEYNSKVKELRKVPSEKILKYVDDLIAQFPSTQTNEGHNINTTYGDYIYYNNNCYLGFDAARNDDSAYLYDSFYSKDCFDQTYSAYNELCYEVVDSGHLYNCNYCIYSGNSRDSSYLINCFDMKDSLGCVNVAHKRYCILNRQLEKSDYERMSKVVLASLKKSNIGWGDLIF